MEPVAHYGLGTASAVTSVEIIWPGGSRLTLNGPDINAEHEISLPVSPSSAVPIMSAKNADDTAPQTWTQARNRMQHLQRHVAWQCM